MNRSDYNNVERVIPFVSGRASLDFNSVKHKPRCWIIDMMWLNLVHLPSLHLFTEILEQVACNHLAWRYWFKEAAPKDSPLPDGFDNLFGSLSQVIANPESVTWWYYCTCSIKKKKNYGQGENSHYSFDLVLILFYLGGKNVNLAQWFGRAWCYH